MMLETSQPGVLAVGDVQAGSTKRVASAVGLGAISVSHIHAFLAEQAEAQSLEQTCATAPHFEMQEGLQIRMHHLQGLSRNV